MELKSLLENCSLLFVNNCLIILEVTIKLSKNSFSWFDNFFLDLWFTPSSSLYQSVISQTYRIFCFVFGTGPSIFMTTNSRKPVLKIVSSYTSRDVGFCIERILCTWRWFLLCRL